MVENRDREVIKAEIDKAVQIVNKHYTKLRAVRAIIATVNELKENGKYDPDPNYYKKFIGWLWSSTDLKISNIRIDGTIVFGNRKKLQWQLEVKPDGTMHSVTFTKRVLTDEEYKEQQEQTIAKASAKWKAHYKDHKGLTNNMLNAIIHDNIENKDYKIVGLSNKQKMPITLVEVENPLAIHFCTVNYVRTRYDRHSKSIKQTK